MPLKRDAPIINDQDCARDFSDADAAQVAAVLDATPGTWERTQEGLAQAVNGEGTPLDKLA